MVQFSKMYSPGLFLHLLMAFFLCLRASKLNHRQAIYNHQNDAQSVIVVDKSGHGNFSTVQEAIDSVPENNTRWIRIRINPGIYSEKVIVPKEKQFIFLEGKSRRTTIIQWRDAGNSKNSSSFILHADNFAASYITFKNTYNILIPSNNGTRMTWAPAILVDADKVSFYKCGFSSLQDTVTDDRGRHLYKNCFIQGAVDFIWGGGQSVFQTCVINVLGTAIGLGPGFITAQARGSLEDPSGFVFKFGQVIGTGQTYLGRPYTSFSRVIFYKTNFSPIIVPEGWSPWNQGSHLNTVTFVEADCMGEGANKGKRIQWLKKLSTKDLNVFVKSPDFIDKEMWLEKIPLPLTEGN
ncbi:putative pectinesterase 29 [Vitis vinifera]|uniref:pectinesterase n=1 Tax=Vitis vinifera TaxID=29760 RepID=A0A438DVA6_VITVI|nr:putative pectinesterase 29 [Vitis vinifera]